MEIKQLNAEPDHLCSLPEQVEANCPILLLLLVSVAVALWQRLGDDVTKCRRFHYETTDGFVTGGLHSEKELIETNAVKTVKINSTLILVEVNNSMWTFVYECHITKVEGKDTIIFTRNQVNCNHVSSNLANKIKNNFLNNPIGADLSVNVHDKHMENDIQCLLTWNDWVNSRRNYVYIL